MCCLTLGSLQWFYYQNYSCSTTGDCKTLEVAVGHALQFGKMLNSNYMHTAGSVVVSKIRSYQDICPPLMYVLDVRLL